MLSYREQEFYIKQWALLFFKFFRNVTTCSKILAYNIVEQTFTTTYDIWPKVSSCCKSLLHYIVSQNFTKTHYISAVKVTTCCKMLAHIDATSARGISKCSPGWILTLEMINSKRPYKIIKSRVGRTDTLKSL